MGRAHLVNLSRLSKGELAVLEAAKFTLLGLSVLVLVGGVVGFAKAKSKPSLIAGSVSAALLGACYLYSLKDVACGLIAGDVICCLLAVMFLVRLKRGAKFMPAGLMMILSILGLAVVSAALAVEWNHLWT